MQLTSKMKFALYSDLERGRYPIWQSLDVEDYLPGSNTLFVTVTGDQALRVEGLPDHQVQEEIVSILQKMYPDITIPNPTDFYLPRWHSDPLFRGSYSNWPSSFVPGHMVNLRAGLSRRLWFAGEASSFEYYGAVWFFNLTCDLTLSYICRLLARRLFRGLRCRRACG